ncbi:hypothetical protein SAMN05421788_112169 [Filimonas lacunae]|uniref:Uncharacterized protein n=1 Tax=Filimonas lacunae TaxID=477680 RepID=A0A173ML44_9BACT|nr:hypothetical protein [Filimonas lacunae]BAV08362.1 hypothetical protein FLA_4398 [Filimonas lacunae]SIT33458.1 hypothetical protein SAMN05421788_112169 [Filimonas lacunae]
MMHCNGKCQMMKKLKQQENKEKQNTGQKGENKTEVLSRQSYFASVEYTQSSFSQSFFTRNNNLVKDMAAEIFHPPAA